LAPLYVLDTAGSIDVLRRVATLRDYEELRQAELEYFDVQTSDATAAALALGSALSGDVLRVLAPTYWLQDQAPYTTSDFTLLGVVNRASGSAPQVYTGHELTLPDYVFGEEDVGRWVLLSGFATAGNNGYAQILSVLGNVATTSKTFAAPQTGSGWAFPWLRIQSDLGPTLEPRYFPMRMSALPWQLRRVAAVITSGSGGVTARGYSAPLVRSVRHTYLAPSIPSATALFDYVGAALSTLQANAALNGTAFPTLLTRTAGP
jgi:hypothetical protein